MSNQTLVGHSRNGFWKDIEATLFYSNSQYIILWIVYLTSGSKGMTTTGTSTSRSYAGDSDMVKSSGNGTALLDASLANDVAEVN